MARNLEEQLVDQRTKRQVLVLVNNKLMFREHNQRFKLKDKDKLRVNLKHLAYYILVQIVYIDNQYKIYKALKVKNKKYLIRIYQALDKQIIQEC